MNPEEGNLRPQIMDRFGLRVVVGGLRDPEDRLEAYRRVHSYLNNPRQTVDQFSIETASAQNEIQAARDHVPQVDLPDHVARQGLALVEKLQIVSLRAEISLFEAARAHAVSDGRMEVSMDDLRAVAPMSLRLRRSTFISDYLSNQEKEEQELEDILSEFLTESD
jgi:magnesium chelatase subunit I